MVAAILAAALSLSAAPHQGDALLALAVHYADGRRTVTPIPTTGRVSWTPAFPRVDGADTSREGLRLFALQFEEAPEPGGVVVTVALLYGSPQERRIPVDTVHVTPTASVRVDALQGFGVKPIVFSIVPLPLADLYLPSVVSPSSSLDITIETVTDPVPGYHAVIVNHSSRDVMMLAFKAFHGDRPGLSGRPRGAGHTPLIVAGSTFVLKLQATPNQGRATAGSGWLPIDRLVITSVLWSDNLVEGDGEPAADEHALDAGTALQLDRILPLLRIAAANPAAHPLPQLRASIETLSLVVTDDEARAAADAIPGTVRLPISQVRSMMAFGMRNARSAVLNDLDELAQAAASPLGAYAAWVARAVSKYEAWHGRITP
jgi:hypothetical protein